MANPQIFWHWQNLPANHETVTPLATEKMPDGTEIVLFFNHTTGRMFFEYEGSYGALVKGEP